MHIVAIIADQTNGEPTPDERLEELEHSQAEQDDLIMDIVLGRL